MKTARKLDDELTVYLFSPLDPAEIKTMFDKKQDLSLMDSRRLSFLFDFTLNAKEVKTSQISSSTEINELRQPIQEESKPRPSIGLEEIIMRDAKGDLEESLKAMWKGILKTKSFLLRS